MRAGGGDGPDRDERPADDGPARRTADDGRDRDERPADDGPARRPADLPRFFTIDPAAPPRAGDGIPPVTLPAGPACFRRWFEAAFGTPAASLAVGIGDEVPLEVLAFEEPPDAAHVFASVGLSARRERLGLPLEVVLAADEAGPLVQAAFVGLVRALAGRDGEVGPGTWVRVGELDPIEASFGKSAFYLAFGDHLREGLGTAHCGVEHGHVLSAWLITEQERAFLAAGHHPRELEERFAASGLDIVDLRRASAIEGPGRGESGAPS